nr:MAG TPA: hypothetical protein [Crassvirales sp.]
MELFHLLRLLVNIILLSMYSLKVEYFQIVHGRIRIILQVDKMVLQRNSHVLCSLTIKMRT